MEVRPLPPENGIQVFSDPMLSPRVTTTGNNAAAVAAIQHHPFKLLSARIADFRSPIRALGE
jgi:hypothetical protein